MDLGLTDKVAFITGASRGIGKGIALALAREGCKVALTATRADLLQAVCQEIHQAFGVEAAWWTGDLLKSEDASASSTRQQRISAVSTSWSTMPGPRRWGAGNLSDEAWESGIGLKFMGYVRVTRAVIPYMNDNKAAVSSISLATTASSTLTGRLCPAQPMRRGRTSPLPWPASTAKTTSRSAPSTLARCAPSVGPNWCRQWHEI